LPASGVFVEASLPSGYAAYANTDEQGMYFIEGMTPGTGIQVLAYHPRTSDVRVTATADIVDAQETVLPDLSFQVMAKIEGWVRDEKGRGLNGAQVHVAPVGEAHACTNSSDVLGQQGTDTDGHYLIDEVQPGRALTVSAGFGFICQEQNREITTLAQGEARQLPDFVYVGGGETGALTLHLIDTAGKSFVVPDGIDLFHEYECGALYFTVSSLDGMQVKSYLAPDVRYVGIVPGTYSAQLSLSWQCATMTFDSASVTIAPEDDVNLGVSIPMVHGRVLDDKGNAVPYPSVSFVIVSPDGKQSETYFAKTNSQGDYLIIAPSFMTGTYSLRVESGWRGNDLEVPVSLTGNLTSSKPALTLDVMLPPTATVVGTVRTASGAVPSSGGVYVMPEGGRQFQTMRDLSSGAFSISGLPAGKHFIEVVAVDPAYVTQSISTSSTAKGYSYVELPVTVPSGTSFVNMGQSKLAGFGTLEVTARDAAGALLPNQNVYLVQTRFGAPSLSYILTYNKLTGSNGKATFIVPENTYGVASRSAGAYDAVAGGYAEASVKAGQTSTATINVKDGLFLGGDSAYAYRSGSLTSADGVVYTPNINDRLIVSGQSHAYGYYDGPLLSIDGIPAPTTYGVRLLNNSREWLYGPFFKGDGLVVKRRVYVPDSGGFVRVVDTVTNTGTAAVNVRMSQTAPSRIGFDVQLSPQGSGNTSVVYSGGQYQDTIGVAYSDGVSALMPVTTLLAAPYDSYWDGSVLLDWRNSVGAGQTMSIVHFHVLGDNDPVSVQGKIQMLVNKTMPGMFDGLTTQERSDIRNFTISQ
jgi:protocatechuate 3,4-dioxygenase beta subunit